MVEALELDVSVEVAVAERSNGYNELLPDLSREKRYKTIKRAIFIDMEQKNLRNIKTAWF